MSEPKNDDKQDYEIDLHGLWNDRRLKIKPSPEGAHAMAFVAGKTDELTPAAAGIVRELFMRQEQYRKSLQLHLSRAISFITSEINEEQRLALSETVSDYGEAYESGVRMGKMLSRREAARALSVALNKAQEEGAG